jgi:O-antigen ligase
MLSQESYQAMKLAKSFPSIWFAAGIVLAAATQLRFGDSPVGPGEIMLTLWLIFAILSLFRDRRAFLSLEARIFIIFWIFGGFFCTAGSFMAVYLDVWNETSFYHDLFSFIFLFVVMATFLIKPDIKNRLREISYFVLPFSIVPLFFLFLYGQRFSNLGPIKLWADNRFTGWAKNPNQVALLIGAIPVIGFYMLNRCKNLTQKVWYGFLILASLPVGIAAKSDALNLSWSVSIVLLITLLYRITPNLDTCYWRNVLAKVLFPLAVLAIFLIAGNSIYGTMKNWGTDTYQEGDQGSIRIALWSSGLEAIKASPIFGLGPGPHSGITPFQGSEAHNTLIDWGACTGIFGLLMYIGLLMWITIRAWNRNNIVLFVSMIELTIVSLFHYAIRHPIFWFYLFFIAVECRTPFKCNSRIQA